MAVEKTLRSVAPGGKKARRVNSTGLKKYLLLLPCSVMAEGEPSCGPFSSMMQLLTEAPVYLGSGHNALPQPGKVPT